MEFKKLSDVEVVEAVSDNANVLIEENGVIKKAPKTQVGGAGGGNAASGAPYLVKINYDGSNYTFDGDFNEVYEVIVSGAFVYAALYDVRDSYFNPGLERFYLNSYSMSDGDLFEFYNISRTKKLIIYDGGTCVLSSV